MKFSMKTIVISLLLAALLCVGASAAFVKTNTYTNGLFSDVKADAWYAGEVKSTYELGLMTGKGYGSFDPNGSVTVAEAITMAARASAAYTGSTIAQSGTEWYDMYVNYAKNKGFLVEGQFDDYNRPAKRYEVAVLFENAMPDGYFSSINNVKEIPDISEKQDYLDELLSLYNAGVVMGSDKYGNFFPENNITRAEAAAIINRVAKPENRLQKELYVYSKDDAYPLARVLEWDGQKEGLVSGWRLDNRAGDPRLELEKGYGAISDTSTTTRSAMIRDINKTTTGRITLETSITISDSFDGFALEFRNEADEPVYRLMSDNESWNILSPDGSYVCVFPNAKTSTKGGAFDFYIVVDLDNEISETTINGVNYGTHPLVQSGEAANLYNFRFTTDEEHKVSAALGLVNMVANYAVYDEFEWDIADNGISYWDTAYLADGESQELKIEPTGVAARSFPAISGRLMEKFWALLDGSNFEFDIRSAGRSLFKVTVDDESIYINGEKVYDYYQGIWYYFATELNTFEHTAKFYLNGRVIAEIELEDKATSVDQIYVKNTGKEGTVTIDNVYVFVKPFHDDYVPVPVKPKGEEKYNIGINVCSLWKNGYVSAGWACISPFYDYEPVLGYYDEGNTELADWEIKYFVEHGVDFQAFCWFPDNDYTGMIIKDPSVHHIYDGYMLSEYSDMMSYVLLWEANAPSPKNMDEWKEIYVPYIIEHYIKDDRYMKIDNKPVLMFYAYQKVVERIGGAENHAEMLDYLDAEVQKLGFDGMIYLANDNSVSVAGLDDMGFDGISAYSWSQHGAFYSANVNNMTSGGKNGSVHHVPTVSVGFNSLPWHGIRYTLMTKDDYLKTHTWVKDEYMNTYVEKNSWQENFLMLSTWNEHGEGTIVFPAAGERGFQYLDVVREVYTDEGEDPSINTIPTADQKARITRLYPQYYRLLRKEGNLSVVDPVLLETVEYSDSTKKKVEDTASYEFVSDGLVGTVKGDTRITVEDIMIEADDVSYIKLICELPGGIVNTDMFFTTTDDQTWNGSKRINYFTNGDGYQEIIMDVQSLASWKGTIDAIRIDPGQSAAGSVGHDFKLYRLEFYKDGAAIGNTAEIDGVVTNFQINSELSPTGEYLIAFDPKVLIDYKLGLFHTWNKFKGELTIEADRHKMVYTLGKSTYILDGVEKDLGFELYARDGLPMIPIKRLCDDLGDGYECIASKEDGLKITTPKKDRVDLIINGGEPGVWEFDINGHSENWAAQNGMVSSVVNGALVGVSNTNGIDPAIMCNKDVNIKLDEYEALEIKCRYKYTTNSGNPSFMQIFYTTDLYPGWSQTNSFNIRLESVDSDGEWVTYRYDISNAATLKGTLKRLRIDPFVAYGNFEMDYVRFIKK